MDILIFHVFNFLRVSVPLWLIFVTVSKISDRASRTNLQPGMETRGGQG